MPSTETGNASVPYSRLERRRILGVARASIAHGLETGVALRVSLLSEAEALQAPRATFVTLKQAGELRGCIGSLEARQALIQDVADNAWNAASRDPRFPPLTAAELPGLAIEVSVLTPLEVMEFDDEAGLLAQIRPGRDGLLIHWGRHRGTFLPAVWEQLPDVTEFWTHLKRKAGLPPDFWDDALLCWRYEAIKITEYDTEGVT
ncbi:MAG: AmmeMemoRadiSam system protein A [Oceanospirillaceae bacterium]|nr:AmmeMemoRadiSam system protein A [Oceanospirillaceae bacterium]